MFRTLLLSTVLVLGACASCSKSKKNDGVVGGGKGPGTGEPSARVDGPLPSFPAGAPPEVYDGDTFTVSYAAAAGNEGGKAVVQVKPKPPYHLNHEYPTELEIKGPEGVKLEKNLWENNPDKREATTWTDDVGAFQVTFGVKDKASVSGQRLEVAFRFAVCTDVSCDPKSAEFAMAIMTP